MLDSVRLAVGTLTAAPTGAVRVTPRIAGRAMMLAPLAVAPLAAVAVAVGTLAARTGWPPLLAGLAVVAVLAAGTRALHLDGLADTVDGLGSGRPAAHALEVMRRGDIGPMGVVALVLVLGGQAAALGALLGDWPAAAGVFVLVCGSRLSLAVGCAAGVPAARPAGLGAAVAGTVPRPAALAGWLALAGLLAALSDPWWSGPLVALAGALAAVALTAYAVRRLGGITGDVLGAGVEASLTAMLLAALW